jgi:hypothetical protein
MMKSPQQELYDYVFLESLNKGYDTYDHLPMASENVNYPFVTLENMNLVPIPNKTSIGAEINLTVNVWGNQDQRLVVDTMASSLLMIASLSFKTLDYRYRGRMTGSDYQIIQDTSVPDTVLNHAIVNLKFSLI